MDREFGGASSLLVLSHGQSFLASQSCLIQVQVQVGTYTVCSCNPNYQLRRSRSSSSGMAVIMSVCSNKQQNGLGSFSDKNKFTKTTRAECDFLFPSLVCLYLRFCLVEFEQLVPAVMLRGNVDCAVPAVGVAGVA